MRDLIVISGGAAGEAPKGRDGGNAKPDDVAEASPVLPVSDSQLATFDDGCRHLVLALSSFIEPVNISPIQQAHSQQAID